MLKLGWSCGSAVLGLALLAVARSSTSGPPVGWKSPDADPAFYEVRRDDREPFEGRFSGLIRCAPCASESSATVMQTIRADRYRGQRVRLAGYLRSADVTLWAGFWMRVDAATRQGVAFDNMNTRPVKGTTPWTRYEVVLDVPEDAVQVAFGILLAGEGQVWADNLSLTRVDSGVPSTDLGFAPDYVAVAVDDDVPKNPRNLGFEE